MQIKKLNERAIIPSKSLGNAGFDLAVQVSSEPQGTSNEDGTVTSYELQPNETKIFKTGLSIYLQNPRLVGFILPRSKLGSKHGIVIANGTGVLDASYQGELMLALYNRSGEAFIVSDAMLVAQLVICEIPSCTDFLEVKEFTEGTVRGEQGINCMELRA